jgi:hypothetical protein
VQYEGQKEDVLRKVLATCAVLMALVAGFSPSPAIGLTKNNLLTDCTTETYAVTSQPTKVKFIIWCGVRSDDVSFALRLQKEGRIEDYKSGLKAWGRGTTSAFRCSRRNDAVRCVGRKMGPVKLQGWITVEGGRCDAGTVVDFDDGSTHVGKPVGCPGTQRFWPHWNLRYLQSERQQFGFDADLNGDQAAIARRIRGLIRAWQRGEPVARGTTSFLGMPLRAQDQREFEYRSEYISQFPEALNPWVSVYARDTYAGYYVDHEHGGTIYIGFVGDQDAQLAAFLSSSEVIAPERVKPFPVPPKHSYARLLQLQLGLAEMAFYAREPGFEYINRIGIDTQGNFVRAVTEQVDAVRQVVDQTFGSEAPIIVVYGRPLEPKTGVRRQGKVKPKKPSASGTTPAPRPSG